ncbi:hypothetical protein UFOVP1290_230 [uncultured Caudovirales phage]|uniref:Uncharacterized protein n=1 Tax=uncultured Caudovirales phage TaxID=2100421 RepID=A0A6J5RGM9_9CAUD|nr:hypothetical protein UFOVP1290_230 [uncultured Caudovirales phage]
MASPNDFAYFSKPSYQSPGDHGEKLPTPCGSKIQRQVLAEKVIRALSKYAYPFGEYLRDKVANEDFEVLHVFSPRREEGLYTPITDDAFFAEIAGAGFSAVRIYSKIVSSMNLEYSENAFVITNPNNYATINVIVRRSLSGQDDHPFRDISVNVNCLRQNKYGDLLVDQSLNPSSIARYAIENNIFEDIKARRFRLRNKENFSKQNHEEYFNLLDKKWKILSGCSLEQTSYQEKLTDKIARKIDAEMINQTKPGWMDPELDKDFVSFKDANPCGDVEVISQTAKKLKPGWTIEEKKPNNTIDSFKNEMNMAAYRATSLQIAKLVKSNIISFMKEKGTDQNKLDLIAELLDTTGGTAVVSAMLGIGLPYAPMVGDDPRIGKLADEFRVAGYSVAMDVVFSALMQYVTPEIIKAMKTLPPIEAKRIVIDDLPQIVEDYELIEDEVEQENLTISL